LPVNTSNGLSPLELDNIKILLSTALKLELPGQNAHRLMLPQGRDLFPEASNENIIQSSVLVLLFPYNGKLSTCLIRRPSAMKHHGGQIAFPGGRHEPTDKDLTHTALRESFEEIGTDNSQIEIIGSLTPLYVQVSNFTINPFVGWSETLPTFKIDNREVDELFIIPVEKFLHCTSNQYNVVNTTHGSFEVRGFHIDQLFIWGATAMIISEFNEIIKNIWLYNVLCGFGFGFGFLF
jgi:8-oxo-dGTP pyrophosphatase MutT (NUDIX family)